MKRNNRLIRDILLELDSSPSQSPSREVFIDGFTSQNVQEHLVLLHDHRIIECLIVRDEKGVLKEVFVKRIAPGGHEFLKVARSEALWKEATAQSKPDDFRSLIRAVASSVESIEEDAAAAARP